MSNLPDPIIERLKVGNGQVEPATGLLTRDNRKERLEPEVMSVFCVLASEPGRVFSKRELFDAVCGLETVENVTLSRCVSGLCRNRESLLEEQARAKGLI